MRYVWGVAITTAAVAARASLDSVLQTDVPFITLYPAVAACAWLGGFGPAALATGTGAIAAAYHWLEPIGFRVASASDLTALAMFGVCGLIMAAMGAAQHRALSQLTAAHANVEQALGREQCARHDAEEAHRLKDTFLMTLSHELRTPLNAVLGWVELTKRQRIDNDRVAHALTVIQRNAAVQARLISDLLDMRQMMSGGIDLVRAPVDLNEVLSAAADTIRPRAVEKGVVIALELSPEPLSVLGDPARLQQIFWNLVSNGVKFTPSGGRVTVSLRRGAAGAEVSVSDTGEGIASEFLPSVFDAFRQEDSSPTRAAGGLGLGLALVWHLTRAHGGTVRVASGGRGHGATFLVTIPMLQIAHHAAAGRQPHSTAQNDSFPRSIE